AVVLKKSPAQSFPPPADATPGVSRARPPGTESNRAMHTTLGEGLAALEPKLVIAILTEHHVALLSRPGTRYRIANQLSTKTARCSISAIETLGWIPWARSRPCEATFQ